MNDIALENQKLTRREREKAAHKQEIIDAAISVFAEKGFHASTLEEIAQTADFSKAAVYLYFSSKEDLLFSILKESLTGWSNFSSATFLGNSDFKTELTTLFKGVADYIFEHKSLFRLLSSQHVNLFHGLSEEKRLELINLHDSLWNNMETRINKAMADGEVRAVIPEAVAGTINGSIDTMVHNQWNCDTPQKLKEAIDSFIEVLFNGIAKKKEG